MARFRMDDFKSIEKTPTSPASLRGKLTQVLYSSTNAKAKVEALNPETGEYRIVIQGTLDRESSRFDEI